MPELAALIKEINALNASNEELAGEVTDLRTEIANLPKTYIPREEADERAKRLKTIATRLMSAFLVVGLVVIGLVWYVQTDSMASCKETRSTLQQVIQISVADRQPLSSSPPETIAAIEELNRNNIRPLREKLLALEGTQPNKC